MKEKYSVKGFGLDEICIDRDLAEFYNKIKESNYFVSAILHTWVSVEDYVNTLYILKFVLKLTNKEMGEKTKINSFYSAYFNTPLGWHYETNDFNECMRMHKENVAKLDALKLDFVKSKGMLENEEFEKFYENSKDHVTDLIMKRSGFSDKREFLQEIYYLYEVKKLSLKDISIYYGITVVALRKRLSSIGIKLSKTEAQQRAVKNGKRNYNKIMKHGRKTMAFNVFSSGLFGSKAENVCRMLLEIILPEKIGDKYEVIVGVNSKNIVEPYEVDIPVVVINNKNINTPMCYKFAIEFNGIAWHKDRCSDSEKKLRLENKGWVYIPINSNVGISDQKYVEYYQKDVDNICNKIKEYIENCCS